MSYTGFSVFFKKKKRYLIGRTVVTPINDTKRGTLGFGGSEEKASLEEVLKSELNLPSYDPLQRYNDRDIGIDIIVSDYSYGFSGVLDLGEYGGFYWFNRPSIKLIARTFRADDYSTIQEFSIVQRMSWSKFIKRKLSIKRSLSFKYLFDETDLCVVLAAACIKLFKNIQAGNS